MKNFFAILWAIPLAIAYLCSLAVLWLAIKLFPFEYFERRRRRKEKMMFKANFVMRPRECNQEQVIPILYKRENPDS
jgi:hypothetical protein